MANHPSRSQADLLGSVFANVDVQASSATTVTPAQTVTPGSVSGVDKERGYFERMVVHTTFPKPEILRLDYKNKKMTVKVQVTGDFLDDEWFWADFLKYFKLKVFVISNLASTNIEFYDYSLFDEHSYTEDALVDYIRALKERSLGSDKDRFLKLVQEIIGSQIYFGQSFLGIPIPDLDDKSTRLENKYIFENYIIIPDSYHKKYFAEPNDKIAIIARTFFDVQEFETDFAGTNGNINTEPLTPENNGLWDMITFDTSDTSLLYNPKKIKAKVVSFFPTLDWNGSFKRTATEGRGFPKPNEKIFFNTRQDVANTVGDIEFSIEDFKEINLHFTELENQINKFYDETEPFQANFLDLSQGDVGQIDLKRKPVS